MTIHEMIAQVSDHYLCEIFYQLLVSKAIKSTSDPVKELVLHCWVPKQSLALADGFGASYLFLKKGRDATLYKKETFLDNFAILSILMNKKKAKRYVDPLLELDDEYIENLQDLIEALIVKIRSGPSAVERCDVAESVAIESEFWLKLTHKLSKLIRSSYMYWDLDAGRFWKECARVNMA